MQNNVKYNLATFWTAKSDWDKYVLKVGYHSTSDSLNIFSQ